MDEKFTAGVELVDLEQSGFDMTDLMRSQLAVLDCRPPTIGELDAMGQAARRLHSDGGAGYVDSVRETRVDTVTAERYMCLSDPTNWLLGDNARANAIIVANLQPEETAFGDLYAYTEDPRTLHEYRTSILGQGEVTERDVVADIIGYQARLVALDTALKRRAHFRDYAASVIALEMSDPTTETDEMPIVAESEVVVEAAEKAVADQRWNDTLMRTYDEHVKARMAIPARERAEIIARTRSQLPAEGHWLALPPRRPTSDK